MTVSKHLRVFRVAGGIGSEDRKKLESAWAFYEIARDALVALIPPPPEFADRIKPTPEQLLWAECELSRNVRARDIAASLIMKSLARRLPPAVYLCPFVVQPPFFGFWFIRG